MVGSLMTIYTLQQQIKPSMRQVVEETLADNAKLVANLVAPEVASGHVETPTFRQRIAALLANQPTTNIWGISKKPQVQQLYITNQMGKVIYDSRGIATGQDYSRWNDVYLTLHGKYGVRSTRLNPKDDNTSVMYVAAPIFYQQQLIGVVTLIKPSHSVAPFISHSKKLMLLQGLGVVILSILLSAGVAWWIRASVYQVRQQALALGQSKTAKPPHFIFAKELNELSQAISDMHQQLENRAYVETYVHTLTHELKSPLTAIMASAELLEDPLEEADRLRFSENIRQQTHKLQSLVDRLLLLAKLENTRDLIKPQSVNVNERLALYVQNHDAQIQQHQLQIVQKIPADFHIHADLFWFDQLLSNLLDNAIGHTPDGHSILIEGFQTNQKNSLHITNQVASTTSHARKMKGTGIGLTLVYEIMQQHQGHVSIENVVNGVKWHTHKMTTEPSSPVAAV
ncbi:unnamed protein product [Rotaria magnacalcarata]|uniref:histidine kinase n=1 Tax=Rotaria magnacalcarata TaxID=392030 RepID=A0A819KQC0_9BILA|nr:unnamed protein product [Rotaria magnacalcarata]